MLEVMKIAVINGPNLNLVGVREPSIYGNRLLADYWPELTSRYPQVEFSFFQSNHEGALIDEIQRVGFDLSLIHISEPTRPY